MVAADKGLHLQHISMCPNHEVEGHLPLVLVVLLTPAICQAIGYAASASSPSEAIGELDDQQVDYDNRFHLNLLFALLSDPKSLHHCLVGLVHPLEHKLGEIANKIANMSDLKLDRFQ